MKKVKLLETVANTVKDFKQSKTKNLVDDKKIREIYHQFKNVIKENVDENKFSEEIRGISYKYAKGIQKATPTTKDPVRFEDKATIVKEEDAKPMANPVTDPDKAIETGEGLKKTGDALQTAAKTIKGIQDKVKSTQTNAPTSSTDTTSVPIPSLYEEQILENAAEILKQYEKPKATKKELMEMFKGKSTTKSKK
jgi:hypothetical protein